MLNLIHDEDEREHWSSFDPILKQTRGCVFFSTPHFGSRVASKSTGKWLKYILLPSVEVSELNTSEVQLILHYSIPVKCDLCNVEKYSILTIEKLFNLLVNIEVDLLMYNNCKSQIVIHIVLKC